MAQSNECENPRAVTSARDETLIKELLIAGVAVGRVAELFHDRVGERELHKIAREMVTESPIPAADLGCVVLQRSRTATKHHDFVTKHVDSLKADAPDELLDPLLSTLMRDPVVISSGYVLDRSTVLDERGKLKFRSCPFTRIALEKKVYPLVEKRRKLQEFKEKRLDNMIITAQTLLAEQSMTELDNVLEAADSFLHDLGEATYIHQSRKLAELCLEASGRPGCALSPKKLARVYIRIHSALNGDETSWFQEKVVALKNDAWQALADGRSDDAAEWCDAFVALSDACHLDVKMGPFRLELAKRRGEDLKVPRQLVFREIREDPEAVQRFLVEEGIDPNNMDELEGSDGEEAIVELRFTDTDGDEVVLRREDDEINEYLNGRLEIRGVRSFQIDARSRRYRDDAGNGRFGPAEDLEALIRQRDLLFAGSSARDRAASGSETSSPVSDDDQ